MAKLATAAWLLYNLLVFSTVAASTVRDPSQDKHCHCAWQGPQVKLIDGDGQTVFYDASAFYKGALSSSFFESPQRTSTVTAIPSTITSVVGAVTRTAPNTLSKSASAESSHGAQQSGTAIASNGLEHEHEHDHVHNHEHEHDDNHFIPIVAPIPVPLGLGAAAAEVAGGAAAGGAAAGLAADMLGHNGNPGYPGVKTNVAGVEGAHAKPAVAESVVASAQQPPEPIPASTPDEVAGSPAAPAEVVPVPAEPAADTRLPPGFFDESSEPP